MSKRPTLLIILASLCVCCTRPGHEKGKEKEQITAAVAANVQFAMKELEAAFEAESGIALDIVISSSGKLATQILQGAPYDLFLSADMKYPQALVEAGKAATSTRVYAYGALVLWTTSPDMVLQAEPHFLLADSVRRIAIANPQNAPYGEQAINYFKYYGAYEQLAPKLAYGESIAQANQYILSRSVEAGITAKSVVLSPKVKGQGIWVDIPTESYAPIEQGAIITEYGMAEHPEGSRKFFDFLFSQKAKAIFVRYGYSLPAD